jgi:hypothetical protein
VLIDVQILQRLKLNEAGFILEFTRRPISPVSFTLNREPTYVLL